MDNLIQICKKANNIVCYGVGNYAGHITTYLLDNEIEINKYCVTDTNDKPTNFFAKSVENVIDVIKSNNTALYILAADKTKREEMESLLKKNDIINIYNNIDDNRLNSLKKDPVHEWHYFLNNIIYNEPSYEIPSTNHEYDEAIENILEKYSQIEIRFFPVWHIAELVDEYLYYKEDFPRDYGKFVLLYPNRNHAMPFKNELKEINSYLCGKFKGENYALLTNDNIDFWKYFIKNKFQYFTDGRDKNIGKKISCFHANMVKLGHFGKRGKKYIEFSSDEVREGQRLLRDWGIKQPYVCLFVRDGLYYNKFLYNENIPESVRIMDEYRNSDVNALKLTCDYLQENNIACIRMGVVSKNRFEHPNCLEYVNNFHSPFMDFFINANCLFYLGEPSGAICMVGLFDKPLAAINCPMISGYDVELPPINFIDRDLLIYQKYWDKKRNKFLTLNEMIDFEMTATATTDLYRYNLAEIYKIYRDNDIVAVKNTPEEILDLATEMYERLMGTKQYDAQDEELQYKYRQIIDRAGRIPGMYLAPIRIGSAFLKKNKWLLE